MIANILSRTLVGCILIATSTVCAALDREDLTFRREALGSYAVDIGQTSVSGISAGAYMADQFLVAYSADVIGAGLFAGGPYNCARGSVFTALNDCMSTPSQLNASVMQQLVDTARQRAAAGQIDDLANLAQRRLYVFSGTRDETVRQGVTDRVIDWYERAGMPVANIEYTDQLPAGHTMPTTDYGNACSVTSAPPWISDCDLDGAGNTLQQAYGPLQPPAPVDRDSGVFIEFPQNEFFAPAGLSKAELAARFSFNEFGYAYVPTACQQGEACRVHIVFHGCKQVYDKNPNSDSATDTSNPFGLQMVLESGYNEWANRNKLIVLYPQAQRVDPNEHIPVLGNPRGCFDWWGYIDGTANTYATKSAPQLAAVRAMLERIAGGGQTGNRPPVVEVLSAAQCRSQICLEGRASDPDPDDGIAELQIRYADAEGNVLIAERDITGALQPDGRFADQPAWPQDNVSYRPTIVAVDREGATTTFSGPEVVVGITCRDWTASNSQHRVEMRAYSPWYWFGFRYFAVGSNEALGAGWQTTTVREEPVGSDMHYLGGCGQ